MKISVKLLAPALMLIPLAAVSDPSYTVETDPILTEDFWKTSFIDGTTFISAAYVPTLSEFDSVTPDGYVSVIANVTSFGEVFNGSSSNQWDRFRYSTYIMSDIDQNLEIVINGDDGHSLYVDGALAGSGGFGVEAVISLDMFAGQAVKLDFLGANSGGTWSFSIGVDKQTISDRVGNTFVFPTNAITSVVGVSMDAEGFVQPLACVGFAAPMSKTGSVKVRRNRAIPLKAQLLGEGDILLDAFDLFASPVLNVIYANPGTNADEDVTDDALSAGEGTDGNQFEFNTDTNQWQFNLMTKNYTAPGTYRVSLNTGDSGEYEVDGACEAFFVIQ